MSDDIKNKHESLNVIRIGPADTQENSKWLLHLKKIFKIFFKTDIGKESEERARRSFVDAIDSAQAILKKPNLENKKLEADVNKALEEIRQIKNEVKRSERFEEMEHKLHQQKVINLMADTDYKNAQTRRMSVETGLIQLQGLKDLGVDIASLDLELDNELNIIISKRSPL